MRACFCDNFDIFCCTVPCQIYFQSITANAIRMDREDASGGEIEIEKIPTRMIEARSKDPIPVFDYLQTPNFQQARCVEVLYSLSSYIFCVGL